MSKMPKKLLEWREKQPRGGIMSPTTFDNIVAEAQKKGFDEQRAKKIAGAAYWKTAKAKFRESQKGK